MELLLDKKKCEYLNRVACGNAIHEESTEIIVSDRSPDISRIIRGVGNVFVTDKEARDGKVSVEGNIKGVVLYVGEGEKCVRKLDVSMPFFHSFDAEGATPDSKVTTRVYLRSFDVREINPRKVSVRANIDISYKVYEFAEKITYEGVKDEEEYGICTRKCTFYGYTPIIMKEKGFSISDDIELSGEENEMAKILLEDVTVSPSETKIIGNKAILKGIAEISYVYENEDGTVHSDERELPFSHILDIEGMEENHDLNVEIAVSGFEFDPQYDAAGKARYITVSITADALATVYEKSESEIIDDAYSTVYEIDVKRNSLTSLKCIDKAEKRVPITESVKTGNGVKRVLDVAVSVFPPLRRREEGREFMASDASVSVMYIGEDDMIYNVSRRVPVVCPIELSENRTFEVSSHIRGKGYSVGTDNEINVRFFTDFDITETEEESIMAVCEISIDAEKSFRSEKRSGITVKRVSDSCDVWSLAKEYATTVSEICVANGISESEKLSQGRMILIPTRR